MKLIALTYDYGWNVHKRKGPANLRIPTSFDNTLPEEKDTRLFAWYVCSPVCPPVSTPTSCSSPGRRKRRWPHLGVLENTCNDPAISMMSTQGLQPHPRKVMWVGLRGPNTFLSTWSLHVVLCVSIYTCLVCRQKHSNMVSKPRYVFWLVAFLPDAMYHWNLKGLCQETLILVFGHLSCCMLSETHKTIHRLEL